MKPETPFSPNSKRLLVWGWRLWFNKFFSFILFGVWLYLEFTVSDLLKLLGKLIIISVRKVHWGPTVPLCWRIWHHFFLIYFHLCIVIAIWCWHASLLIITIIILTGSHLLLPLIYIWSGFFLVDLLCFYFLYTTWSLAFWCGLFLKLPTIITNIHDSELQYIMVWGMLLKLLVFITNL